MSFFCVFLVKGGESILDTENYVKKLLELAVNIKASDIYIAPIKNKFSISFTVQNKKSLGDEISALQGNQIINYFKFQSGMDIGEHRRPQIGSQEMAINGKKINLRLSSVGDFLGREVLVIRMIYPLNKKFENSKELLMLSRKKGLILFCGPMGSGKTTTMYNLASQLAQEKRIMCIEDPTEINVEEFIQFQVNEEAGIGYEELIKSSLRQRPDVLIIGEIRDNNTAQLVIKAALSGYTVYSTIHAKSKFAVINRMLEFGVDETSLKDVLISSVYQRLIPNIDGNLICVQDILKDEELTLAYENKKNLSWENIIEKILNKKIIDSKTAGEYRYG